MTISQATTNFLKVNNIEYSTENFSKAMNEVKKTYTSPVRESKKVENEKLSFMSNHLTTDKRLK